MPNSKIDVEAELAAGDKFYDQGSPGAARVCYLAIIRRLLDEIDRRDALLDTYKTLASNLTRELSESRQECLELRALKAALSASAGGES